VGVDVSVGVCWWGWCGLSGCVCSLNRLSQLDRIPVAIQRLVQIDEGGAEAVQQEVVTSALAFGLVLFFLPRGEDGWAGPFEHRCAPLLSALVNLRVGKDSAVHHQVAIGHTLFVDG